MAAAAAAAAAVVVEEEEDRVELQKMVVEKQRSVDDKLHEEGGAEDCRAITSF